MIQCLLCGKEFRTITNSHLLHSHDMTVKEYLHKFSEISLTSGDVRTPILASPRKRKYDLELYKNVGLGTKPDSVIARELGIDRRTLTTIRNKLGIASFGGIILLQEDIPCRSIYEAMYDAYLHWKNIPHKHEVKIPNLPYIADFQLENHFVEIAGMTHFKKYERKLELKREIYTKNNIPVVWLSCEDVEALFRDCTIPLKFRENRACEVCGQVTYRIIKNLCKDCYMDLWRIQQSELVTCEYCGTQFNRIDNRKFCSHSCYSKSLELDWPSWEWIDEQLKSTSIRQLAIQLGVKPPSMYMRLRRRKGRNNGQLV
jgi:hypothetical protein